MLSYLASLATPSGKEDTTPTTTVNVAVSPDMSDEAILRQVRESMSLYNHQFFQVQLTVMMAIPVVTTSSYRFRYLMKVSIGMELVRYARKFADSLQNEKFIFFKIVRKGFNRGNPLRTSMHNWAAEGLIRILSDEVNNQLYSQLVAICI